MRLAVLLLLAAMSAAEIRVENSVEWSVTDSDLVVRGRIVDVKAAGENQRRVTLKVEETLEGEPQEQVEFIVAADEADRKTEMVCFLVRSARLSEDDRDLKEAPWALQSSGGLVALEGEKKWGLTDRESNDHATRDAMLAAIRRAVRAMPRRIARSLAVEHPVVPNENAVFGTQYLIVPVDAWLEAQARKMLEHEKPEWRVKGVRILRYFRSERNIELIKALLKDEAHTSVSLPGGWSVLDHKDGENLVYPVRVAAYRVLRDWREPVTPPVMFVVKG